MRRAVVVDHLRVVHGHVRRPLPEVLHGVAALAHDRVDEPVGGARRLRRRVDELCLDQAPPLEVAVTRGRVQCHDLQLLASCPAVPELVPGVLAAAGGADGAFVLRSEPPAKPCGAPPAQQEPREHQHRDHDDDDGDEQAGIHWPLLSIRSLVPRGGAASRRDEYEATIPYGHPGRGLTQTRNVHAEPAAIGSDHDTLTRLDAGDYADTRGTACPSRYVPKVPVARYPPGLR